MSTTDRIIALEGVENFRDYGDYATAAGRRLPKGRLLRSGHHARATDADLEHLAELAVVVDLRHPSERLAQPSRRHTRFVGRVIESEDAGNEAEPPHLRFLRENALTVDSGLDYMIGAYRRIPFESRHVELFSRYFEALAEADGPVLIHCAIGKDRTGILAALTHHVAGVSDADAIADYLLTNQVLNQEGRALRVGRQIAETFGQTPTDEALQAFLSADERFLEAAFAEMRARHGSLDGYLETALGVDKARRERLEAALCG
jgi:protein tyrosine/serine phosphatase